MKYQAIYERAADGSIWGYCPEIPGAAGAGDTLEEARASLREGVRLWIETAAERGIPVPEPSAIAVETIDVPAA